MSDAIQLLLVQNKFRVGELGLLVNAVVADRIAIHDDAGFSDLYGACGGNGLLHAVNGYFFSF